MEERAGWYEYFEHVVLSDILFSRTVGATAGRATLYDILFLRTVGAIVDRAMLSGILFSRTVDATAGRVGDQRSPLQSLIEKCLRACPEGLYLDPFCNLRYFRVVFGSVTTTYLLWVSFASALNYSLWHFNPQILGH